MTETRPILEVDGLGKTFGRRTVLKSAGYAAVEGRVTTLMGRNGAGKTTMLRITVGRVRPDHGRVAFRGQFLPRPTLASLARAGMMYISQRSALTKLFSVGDHLAAFAQVFDGQARLEAAVDQLRLEPFLKRRSSALSGGERQRASLALALIRSPACLLMDEPFAGTSPADRSSIATGIEALRNEGTAVVITGHEVADLFAVSDEVIWVTAGTSHWLGSPDEAGKHEQFRREYLGPSGPRVAWSSGRDCS